MKQINFKNIITNLVGLVIWGLAILMIFNIVMKNLTFDWIHIFFIIMLIAAGIALFLFENKDLQILAKKGINKFISKKE